MKVAMLIYLKPSFLLLIIINKARTIPVILLAIVFCTTKDTNRQLASFLIMEQYERSGQGPGGRNSPNIIIKFS